MFLSLILWAVTPCQTVLLVLNSFRGSSSLCLTQRKLWGQLLRNPDAGESRPTSQWQWRNPLHPCRGKSYIWVTTREKCWICFWIGWENIYICITTRKPLGARSCCGALGPAGRARLCHSLSSRAPWGTPWSALIPKPCWGTKHEPLAGLGQNQRGAFLSYVTIMDAECLCPSVVNFLVSTMANVKEVHASQRNEFQNIAKVQGQKIFVFSQVRESQYLILRAQHLNKDLFILQQYWKEKKMQTSHTLPWVTGPANPFSPGSSFFGPPAHHFKLETQHLEC